MREAVRFVSVPKEPEELPAPTISLRAGAPVASWDEVVPLGAVPSKWLILWVRRIVSVPSWLRGAAAIVLLRRAQDGTIDDGSLDRIERVTLPGTLEEAQKELDRWALKTRSGRILRDPWQRIVEDFVSSQRQRRELRLEPLPVFDEE